MIKNLSIFNFRVLRIPILFIALFLLSEEIFRLIYLPFDTVIRPWKYVANASEYLKIKNNDPVLDWTLRPNYNGTMKGRVFTTNSHGFRGNEYTKEKQTGIKRIGVLGSSVSLGAGVDYEETYSYKLGSMLDSNSPGNYEVINFSVFGHTLDKKSRLYDIKVRKFTSDVLLLPFDMPHLMRQQKNNMPRWQEAKWHELNRIFFSQFFVYKALRSQAKNFFKSPLRSQWKLRINGKIKSTAKRTEEGKKLVEDIIRKANQDDTHMVVLLYPLPTRTVTKKDSVFFQQWLGNRSDVSFIDCSGELGALVGKNDLNFPGDNHPNARAHNLYAQCIYPKLVTILEEIKKRN